MCYYIIYIRKSVLVDAKSCKIQKTLHFTRFDKKKKKNHINGCKIVHKYINATVTVHIYARLLQLLHLIFYHFSLWSDSRFTLSFPPLISIALLSLATAVPLSITSLTAAYADHRCYLFFFLFDGFGILISGF